MWCQIRDYEEQVVIVTIGVLMGWLLVWVWEKTAR